MAHFSKKLAVARPLVVNAAGGLGSTVPPEHELSAMLVTSFGEDQFYRSAGYFWKRMAGLIARVPAFAAQATVAARQTFGFRTTSHFAAAIVAYVNRGQHAGLNTRKFIYDVVRRPDDMVEILAAYESLFGAQSVPNGLRRGLADAFGKFDTYALAKYQMRGHAITLADVMNFVHPRPTEQNEGALKALASNSLVSEDTWESAFSKLGPASVEDKAALWFQLIASGKLGLFALLRNLRNIEEVATPELVKAAADALRNPSAIHKSLIMPFRYIEASKHVTNPALMAAIDEALTISLDNMPPYGPETLVAVDESGSMQGRFYEVASTFAAAMAVRGVDVMLFCDDARYVKLPRHSVLEASKQLRASFRGAGTNVCSVFELARSFGKQYNRIIILSDEQSWHGGQAGFADAAVKSYCAWTGANPVVISWDVAHYGTMQFPRGRVVTLFGWSEAVLPLLPILEGGAQHLSDVLKLGKSYAVGVE